MVLKCQNTHKINSIGWKNDFFFVVDFFCHTLVSFRSRLVSFSFFFYLLRKKAFSMVMCFLSFYGYRDIIDTIFSICCENLSIFGMETFSRIAYLINVRFSSSIHTSCIHTQLKVVKIRTNRFTNSQISFFDELLESWNFQSIFFFTRIMLTKTKKLFTHTRYYYSDYITLRLSLLVPGSVWTYMYEQCVSWIVSYFFFSFRFVS